MRVFVTGGTGLVGTAVVRELVTGHHTVAALARSDQSAAQLSAAGVAHVIRGDVADTACLQQAARDADAVIHLAFELSGDLAVMARSIKVEAAAIAALGDALAGSQKPLIITSGTSVAQHGQLLHETDTPADPARGGRELLALPLRARGVRVSVIRLPLVYFDGDSGVPAVLTQPARTHHELYFASDEPTLRTPVVHRDDAARLYRLVLERTAEDAAVAGLVWHAVAEEVPIHQLLQVIARRLHVPLRRVDQTQMKAHYGFFAAFFSTDIRVATERTRATFGWRPTKPSLLAELAPLQGPGQT